MQKGRRCGAAFRLACELNALERAAIESESLVNGALQAELQESSSALVCRAKMGALNSNPKYWLETDSEQVVRTKAEKNPHAWG